MTELHQAIDSWRIWGLPVVDRECDAGNPRGLRNQVACLVMAREIIILLTLVELNMLELVASVNIDFLTCHGPIVRISTRAIVCSLDNIAAHQDWLIKVPAHGETFREIRAVLVIV